MSPSINFDITGNIQEFKSSDDYFSFQLDVCNLSDFWFHLPIIRLQGKKVNVGDHVYLRCILVFDLDLLKLKIVKGSFFLK